MTESVAEIESIEELLLFVHQTLCEKENLLTDQFVTRHTQLLREGRSCGLRFQLQGPRSVRLSAVWASDQNLLYFYDTRGERYLKIKLLKRLVVAARAA